MGSESEWISQYGYLAVLVGAIFEGDGVAILAGLAAHHGLLTFAFVVAAVAAGGMINDQVLYQVGRRYGERLAARFNRHQARIERGRNLIQQHPWLSILGVRFAYGFRLIGPFLIGSSGIPLSRFLPLNAVGALLWSLIMVSLGYGAGAFVLQLLGHLHGPHRHAVWLGIALAWVVIAALVARYLIRRRARQV